MWDITRVIRILDVAEKACVFLYTNDAAVYSVLFGCSKTTLLSAGKSGTLSHWTLNRANLTTAKPIQQPNITWSPSSSPMNCVALSPDETYVAVGCSNAMIYLHNLYNAQPLAFTWCDQSLKGHRDKVTSLLWGTRWLVSGSYDATVRIWDLTTLSNIAVFQGDGSLVQKIAWLPGERHVVASQNKMLSILDIEHPLDYSPETENITNTVTSFSPFKHHVATGHADGSVSLWSRRMGST